jgi:hypothetical protein
MPSVDKHIVHWHGLPDPGAVNVFFAEEGTAITANDALRAWYYGFSSKLPNEVSITIDPSGVSYDIETGAVTGSYTGAEVSAITGADTGSYAAGTGVCFTWDTNAVVGRRRLRGRTFVAPLSSIWGDDGQITNTVMEDFTDKVATFLTTWSVVGGVWHRPVNDAGGSFANVSGANFSRHGTMLASRRG